MQNQWRLYFLHITVRFHAYLFIFTYGKTLLIFCYHRHIHLMSVIEVKTQTRFMVLFTSGSLLTWGNLQIPCLASPWVFACYLPLINYIPLSFTDLTLWQSMPFFCKKQNSGGKIWFSCGGTSTFALCCIAFNFPVTPRWNSPPWMALRLGWEAKTLPQHCFLISTGRGGGYRGQKLWSIDCMGEP